MAILDAVESRVCCSGYNSDYATEYSPLSSGTECGGEGESPRRDWETRLGHGAALSLSILEIKRLLLLSLEMLIDSRPVRFAGALAPLLVSFCDVGLGFPVAVATLYALRRRRSCCGDDKDDDSAKDRLRRRICMLCLCVTLNVVTLVLIAVHVDTDASSLEKVFKMSMKFYSQEASHKLAVDDLQLDLECCGFSSYSDWFGVDWQEKIGTMYYADSEEEDDYPPAAVAADDSAIELEDEQTQRMDLQTVVGRGVPYSCCAKWILVPCASASPIDPRTLNQGGCAAAIAAIMLRLAVVGYLVTALVIFSQILLVLLLCRIVKKMTEEAYKSECSCWESSCPPSSDAYLSQRQSAKSSLRRYRKANRQRLLRLAASRGGSSKLLLPPSRYRRRQFFKSTTSLCTNDDAAPTSIFSNSEGESSATSPSSSREESTTANTDRGMMSCG